MVVECSVEFIITPLGKRKSVDAGGSASGNSSKEARRRQ